MSATQEVRHAIIFNTLFRIMRQLQAQGMRYEDAADVTTEALAKARAYVEQGQPLTRIIRSLNRHFGVEVMA